jgi:hypothetical protein
MVGVKEGVRVIGGSGVGVAVREVFCVGSGTFGVAASTDVAAGVSVATIGITGSSGVAVM